MGRSRFPVFRLFQGEGKGIGRLVSPRGAEKLAPPPWTLVEIDRKMEKIHNIWGLPRKTKKMSKKTSVFL
jgi:hypothetical protein